MKHLLKGLAFFVGFNAMIVLAMCWYNLLIGNGFNVIGIDTDTVFLLVCLGTFYGMIFGVVIYVVSLENDN